MRRPLGHDEAFDLVLGVGLGHPGSQQLSEQSPLLRVETLGDEGPELLEQSLCGRDIHRTPDEFRPSGLHRP